MDKPALLEAIQHNHPAAQLEYIQMLAKAELNRQIEESIKGMLHKKPVEQLLSVLNYKEEYPYAIGQVEDKESIQEERKDGDSIWKASKTSGSNRILSKRRK